ncbi:proline/serine-rich coiled-coil protein 1 isoform X2 [Anas platyrhynchos]|uniref:proline/serine-rich coiled-coil protein 1 isoform X2 n=1 Tax=Anas platyrhynchos TaxID=8839 RepID=UPI0018D6072C|nr:proline/serine-rich coiled-coil protein 1 isoform X1 [Anas platyrhynchos]
MTEERGRAAAPEGARPHGAPPDGSPRCHPPGPPRAPPDVRFITEERFDFSVLSPADSREEDEEDEESPGGVRWSPLSGAQLEEMVREATRLAAQLQHSHLPPLGPGPSPPGGGGSPRNPRRETFVVKDSPVRELLPTVPPAREDTPGCHPPPAPKGPPARGRGTLGRGGPSRLCPPRGAGAAARGRSEPLRKGPAGSPILWGQHGDREQRPPGHQRTPRGWGLSGVPPPTPPSLPGQPKARGGAAAAPPTRAPRARATTAAVPVPSSRPPPPSAIPKPPPGRAGTLGTAPGGRAPPRASVVAPRGAGAAPGGAGSGCRAAPPSSRLRPPRKTTASSTLR